MAEEKACNGDGGDDCAPEEVEKKIGLANGDGGAPPEKEKKKKNADPQLLICLLQPAPADSDPDYIGIRRLLLSRKPQSPFQRRLVIFFSSSSSSSVFNNLRNSEIHSFHAYWY